MFRKMTTMVSGALAVSGALSACGADVQVGAIDPGGSRAVGQGGAKDIARFRAIVSDGEVPAPETLDEVGFFAEHAVDLPPADCGRSICLHAMLAVAPKFDNSNWTMAFVGMNSSLDPDSIDRPPAHVIVMLEDGEETPEFEAAMQSGMLALAGALRPEDRISVARYGARVHWLVRGIDASRIVELGDAFAEPILDVGPGVSPYDALAAAGEAADMYRTEGVPRILLVTNGKATAGVTQPSRIVALAEALAERGTSLSVVGFGASFDDRLPLALGEIGAGTYAYAVSDRDLITVLRQEGETSLFPLAREMTVVVRAAPGYRIGKVYGAARAQVFEDRAELSLPALFLGHRTGSQDVKQGRRGGGGGLFVELIAEQGRAFESHRPAFVLDARWIDAAAQEGASEHQEVENVYRPGENPPLSIGPYFSDPSRGKIFMMLNMYLGLRSAVDFYDQGECGWTLGISEQMMRSVDAWQEMFSDPDIEEDRRLLQLLDENVRKGCTAEPAVVPFSGSCFFI